MLSHYFLQTLLQSLDPTPESFPITLDRAAASQIVEIVAQHLSEGGRVGLIDVWIDLVSVAQSVEHSPGL